MTQHLLFYSLNDHLNCKNRLYYKTLKCFVGILFYLLRDDGQRVRIKSVQRIRRMHVKND
jgi:hypothetical protein